MYYPQARVIPNRAGWRRGEGEDQVWLILPTVFADIYRGFDVKMVAKVLADRGMLDRPENGRGYQRQHWISGRNTRGYAITAGIFSGSNTESVASVASVARGLGDKDFCDSPDEPLTTQKPANTKGLATLATQNDQDPQCEGPDPDGGNFDTEDEDTGVDAGDI